MVFEFEISLDCKGPLPLKQSNSLFHCCMCTNGWRKHLFVLSVLLPFSIIQMPSFFKNLLSLFHSCSFSLLLLKIYYYCCWRDSSVVMSGLEYSSQYPYQVTQNHLQERWPTSSSDFNGHCTQMCIYTYIHAKKCTHTILL